VDSSRNHRDTAFLELGGDLHGTRHNVERNRDSDHIDIGRKVDTVGVFVDDYDFVFVWCQIGECQQGERRRHSCFEVSVHRAFVHLRLNEQNLHGATSLTH
jgi:hypothetical protein